MTLRKMAFASISFPATPIWKCSLQDSPAQLEFVLQDAARLLREGEVVAFPTETVYGLGANAFSDSAVRKIFYAKRRPSDNPLIVHVATLPQFHQLIPPSQVSEVAATLIGHFWPGPLTLVFKRESEKARQLASVVTGL